MILMIMRPLPKMALSRNPNHLQKQPRHPPLVRLPPHPQPKIMPNPLLSLVPRQHKRGKILDIYFEGVEHDENE